MPQTDPTGLSRRAMLLATAGGAAALLMQPLAAQAASPAGVADPLGYAGESAAAKQKADGWMARLALPPGAVNASDDSSPAFSIQHTSWWSTPMVVSTGYWTIAGTTVARATQWLTEHPTADLIVPTETAPPEGEVVDIATIGNVPFPDALEGIAYTVARTSAGVAIRAEIGVLPDSAVRSTSEGGVYLGGPGQG